MTITKTWQNANYLVTTQNGIKRSISVLGRDRWALEELIKAGAKGCTPIHNPAPRWAAYIHNLRALGLPIDTHIEAHAGPFAGTHARYELVASVAHVVCEVAA